MLAAPLNGAGWLMNEIKDIMKMLAERINRANESYYRNIIPTMGDRTMLKELEEEYPEFADPNSPTQRAGF